MPTALVTGGSRGIGRAICLRLAADGYDIMLNYAGNTEKAEETAALCREKGATVFLYCCDVSDNAAVEAMCKACIDTFGSIDVLVNNAGITRDGLLMRMSESDFDTVLDTNLKGTFLCIKHVSRYMMKKRCGRIINLSSVVGLTGNAGQANYAASKAGVIGLTKSAAKELASRNITVNAIAPGFIETDMTAVLPDAVKDTMKAAIPLGRYGTPEDIADMASFLASSKASYITGQVFAVDGGMTM